jgi:predicted ATPase
MSSPAARYAALLAATTFRGDAAQARAVQALTVVHASLLRSAPLPPRGLYLHSGPGRGKTALVSLLVHPLVLHVHAHAFFREMHVRVAGARGDVSAAAAALVAGARVLALDEMEVTDVADALVLARVVAALRARGVALLATSNRAPEALFAGGLNVELFQPAFGRALRESCDVICLDGDDSGGDYRRARDAREATTAASTPHTLMTSARGGDAAWHALCDALAAPVGERRVAVPTAGRDVFVEDACGRAARVHFSDLCCGNYSAACFSALAAEFDIFLLDGVPALVDAGDDALRRFVLLVDILYARGAILVLVADAHAPWVNVVQLFAGVGGGSGGGAAADAGATMPALRVVDAGGSSGRLTTMVSPTLEWSATGRVGASLADLAPGKFAAFSAARCASRLHEMTRGEWVARSVALTSTAAEALARALARALRAAAARAV